MLKKNIERYSRKNNYKSKYTEAQLLAALQVVDDGNMSIRKAAKRYGVPFTTIRDRVAGKTTSKVGRPPVLTEDEEAIISERLAVFGAWGFPLTTKDLISLIKNYLDNKGVTSRSVLVSTQTFLCTKSKQCLKD